MFRFTIRDLLWLMVAGTALVVAKGDEIDLRSLGRDLQLSLRPHTRRPTFGDRLILQVTVVNRGTDTIRALPFGGLLEFRAKDPVSGLEVVLAEPIYSYAMLGKEPKTISYEPNKPMTILEAVGLPANARDFEHPFWKRLNGVQQLDISCVFHIMLGPGLKISSAKEPIRIEPRPELELAALQRYAAYDKKSGDTTISPGAFGGIGFDGLRYRHQTEELAASIKSGDLAGILQLTVLMQRLKHDDVDRDALSKQVLDWVAAQPDIKRQWVAWRVLQPTLSASAQEKLRAIANEPVAPLDEP